MLNVVYDYTEKILKNVQGQTQSEPAQTIQQPQQPTQQESFSKVNESRIIQINNELNGLFTDQLKFPKIVVVGGQSSGKSTVLNNLITMNILPTGSEMVTRTPLCMEMNNCDAPHIEFGKYAVGNGESLWKCEKNIKVTYPEPTSDELNAIRLEIEKQTILLAGNDKNISHNPIIVKIFLPNVPNLTLVDLPGITQVACKDKGQPEDIKEQIEKLIGSYIKSEETIILSIIPARTDVEADVGVGLVKKYDPDFNRSIGVLTKVDLMNVDTDVSSYVSGNISKNLRMNYGYYLVRNRTNKEMNEITMHDGFKKEQAFFQNHSVYSKMSDNDKKKMGTNNLRDKLVTILSNKIKELLPMISKQIVQKYTDTCKELIQLGSEIPQDQLSRQTYVHHLILNLSQVFIQAIDGMDKDNYNIGRHLKDNYIAYRDIINKLDPITEFDAKYIDNISKNVEGNHMSFLVPSISVFEACIRDEKYKPVQKMLHPSIECIRFTSKQLSTLVTELLNSPNSEIHRYPKLIAYLEYKIISNIIIPYEDKTNEFVRELIDMEESYVWTDSDQFKHNVSEMLKTKAIFDNTTIKTLLTIYYNTVKDNIKNNVPKAIMLHLVLRLKKNLLNELMTKIDNNEICNLLEENTEIGLRRTQLSEWKEKLTIAKKKLGL